MDHVSEQLDWSYMSLFGAFLGYALHVSMSWQEWRKVSKQPTLTLRTFLTDDPPSQITGVILVVVLYCSLTTIAQWEWAKTTLQGLIGFSPKVDFFGAFMTAFTSQGFGVKLVNILKKINSAGP